MNGYFVEQDNAFMLENEMEFFLMKYPTLKTTVEPHIHDSVELLFIVKGAFKITCENMDFDANVGDMFLFRSQVIHSVIAKEAGAMYYVLKIKPSLILSLSSKKNGPIYSMMLSLALSNSMSKIYWTSGECIENGIRDTFERMADELECNMFGMDLMYKTCIGKILFIIINDIKDRITLINEHHRGDSSFIRKLYDLIAYINIHYSEDITLEECSQRLSVSYSYFSRRFKQITGKNFKEYLIRIRINHAEKLLLSTERPITEIATECGFNSITYFSSMYKEIKGIPPSQARNQNN